jgi:Protein of unknown function (DUF3179).
LLAALAGVTGTAGCLGLPAGEDAGDGATPSPPGTDDTVTAADAGTATGGQTGGQLAEFGRPSDICERDPVEDPGIHAVVRPAFSTDWSGVERRESLAAEAVVVGVERAGRARAYPVSVLTRHEVVNDEFGGPLLVTYCPLCRSGLVTERHVDGAPTTFRVTGLLWQAPRVRSAAAVERGDVFGVSGLDPDIDPRNRGNLVMVDDRTGSYWSQILARAICGPARGDDLTPVAATTTTWGEWRDDHPATQVLLPPPVSETE